MADLVVAGAGMAGLAAAAEARRLGAEPLVLEKLGRPGGSMRLSSGVIWRHRDFGRFREECPDGDELLQRLLFERLDDDLSWLESLGAPVVARETGNPLTTGIRFDPVGSDGSAGRGRRRGARGGARCASRPRMRRSCLPPAASLQTASCSRSTCTPEADHAFLRAAPGSTGDGLRLRTRGGRGEERRARPGVRPRHAGAAGADRRGRPRASLAALRAACGRHERAR